MEKHIKSLFTDEILKKAALSFGAEKSTIKKVGGFENFIYEFKLNQVNYILRISHSDHRSLKMIESELDWLNFLALNGASVSKPIKSKNNLWVEKIPCNIDTYFTASAYHKAKGCHINMKEVTPSFLEKYGKAIGKLHQLTKSYQPTSGILKRNQWDEDLLIVNAEAYLPYEEKWLIKELESLCQTIKQLPKNEKSYGLIHTDIHMGNFFVWNDEITIFDFDDCCYMYLVSDIAIALYYYLLFKEDEEEKLELGDEFMKYFMKGYKQENQLSSFCLSTIPYFLKLRAIILYIAIYRSLDVYKDSFAVNFIKLYHNKIKNNEPIIKLDFKSYA